MNYLRWILATLPGLMLLNLTAMFCRWADCTILNAGVVGGGIGLGAIVFHVGASWAQRREEER